MISANVKTNTAKNFLWILAKRFPTRSPLHKIFNKNTFDQSQLNSYMPNTKSVIGMHNAKLLRLHGKYVQMTAIIARKIDALKLVSFSLHIYIFNVKSAQMG